MQAPTGYYDEAPRKKPNYTWLWIVAGIIVLCGCGGIGTLAAILYPVFAQARMKARQTACLGNVRSLTVAGLVYASDFDDRLPSAANWMDSIRPYDARPRSFYCPALGREPDGSRKSFGYAVNSALAGKATKTIPHPVNAIWIFESADLARNASGNPDTSPAPNRHAKGRSLGFLDGHAEFQKQP